MQTHATTERTIYPQCEGSQKALLSSYALKNQMSLNIYQDGDDLFFSVDKVGESKPLRLVINGVPKNLSSFAYASFFLGSYPKSFSSNEGVLRIDLSSRLRGGGWKESVVGTSFAAVGAGVILTASPALIPAMASSAAISMGVGMVSKGCRRSEDSFDKEFFTDAAVNAASGAALGSLGGGFGGMVINKVGASTVVSRQIIHAGVNATCGALHNVTKAFAIIQFSSPERKKEAENLLSTRNLAASAVGAATGGFAGATAGSFVNVLPSFPSIFKGMGAGFIAGGFAAGGAAVLINKQNGEPPLEGVSDAMALGAMVGTAAGGFAASRTAPASLRNIAAEKQYTEYVSESKVTFTDEQFDEFIKRMNEGMKNRNPEDELYGLYENALGETAGKKEVSKATLFSLVATGILQGLLPSKLEEKIEREHKFHEYAKQYKEQRALEEQWKRKNSPQKIAGEYGAAAPPPQRYSPYAREPSFKTATHKRSEGFQEAPKSDESESKEGDEKGLLDKEIERAEKKIKTLEELDSEKLKREISLQKLERAVLEDPAKAAGELTNQLKGLKPGEFLMVPTEELETHDVLYKDSEGRLRQLKGEEAKTFLSSGAGPVGVEGDDEIVLDVDYNCQKFERETSGRFELNRYARLQRADQKKEEPKDASSTDQLQDFSDAERERIHRALLVRIEEVRREAELIDSYEAMIDRHENLMYEYNSTT